MDQRRRMSDLPRAQQAGILCTDPQFQAFIAAERDLPAPASEGLCAEHVRLACGVNSRASLDNHPTPATRFDALRTAFDAWRGAIANPRT